MIWLLFALAHGSQCLVEPSEMSLSPDEFLTRGSFSVRVEGGAIHGPKPEELAQRFRLRGPDRNLRSLKVDHLHGEVRFTVEERLLPGTYTVEHRANFDSDGRRIKHGHYSDVTWSGWFPYETLNVTADATLPPEKLTPPKRVTWSRSHAVNIGSAGPSRSLLVRAHAKPETWVELEVDGVGVVARSQANSGGQFGMRLATSLCTSYPVDVPTTGDLRVRLVALGSGGTRTPGTWKTLGPSSGQLFGRRPKAASRPSKTPADLSSFRTWQSVDHQPEPGETHVASTTCGRLVASGDPKSMNLAPDEVMKVDANQVFRRLRLKNGVLSVDSKDVDVNLASIERAALHLAGTGSQLTIGVQDYGTKTLYLLRLNGTSVAHRTDVPEVHRTTTFENDGTVLRLAWSGRSGTRWQQSFAADLSPLAPARELLDEIRITDLRPESGGYGIGVNGHSVRVLDSHHLRQENTTEFEGRAYISAQGSNGSTIAVVQANGTTDWFFKTNDHYVGVGDVVVDERGVHLTIQDYRSRTVVESVRTFRHDGVEIVPALPMPPKPPYTHRRRKPASKRLHDQGRTLVITKGSPWTLGVEENGVRSPETPIGYNAAVAVRPNGADIIWTTHRWSPNPTLFRKTHAQSLSCTGESVGVPNVWTPVP